MRYSGLNTNKDRRAFWESLAGEKGEKDLQAALSQIDPTSARVLKWHYIEGKSLKEITHLLNRSISIVRNHHNRGIFQLQQYLAKKR